MILSIAWPITCLIMFFTGILFFRKPVYQLLVSLSKVKNLQYKNFNIQLGEAERCFPERQQEYTTMKQKELSKTYQSPLITAEEKLINEQLSSAGVTSEQAIDLLIYHLAYANLSIRLLNIDKLIFNEQIKLLSFLNIQNKPCPEVDLLTFYQEWRGTKETDYEFADFLNFLQCNRLITQSIGGYSIGLVGKEYLCFLIRVGRLL